MRHSILIAVLAVSTAVLVASAPANAAGKKQAADSSDGQPTTLHRSLLSGGETRLAQFGWLSGDCKGLIPDVRIIKRPAKGEIRFEKTAATVTASRSALQKKCLGKPVEAMAVYYRAERGSIGTDKVILDVDSKLGRVFHYTIQVGIEPAATDSVQSSTAQQRVTRIVLKGNETRLSAPNYLNADCSSGPLPDLRIVSAPKNGTYRTEESEIPAERPIGNVRANCNGKPVKAVALYYKPKDDFAGDDDMVVDVDYRNGTVRRFDYAITVH